MNQDDLCSGKAMLEACKKLLPGEFADIQGEVSKAEQAAASRTAWRLGGTLREFPSFPDLNLWFDYPVHKSDPSGVFADIVPDEEKPAWQRNFSKKKSPEDRKKERAASLEIAFEACKIDGEVTLASMAEYLGVTEKTVRNRLKEHKGFWIDEGTVGMK